MAPENDDAGDFDKLARRYLDLWQSQLAGLASDQALTEQIARLFAAANTQVASALQAAQGAHHASQAGTPSAASTSGHGAHDVGMAGGAEELQGQVREERSVLGHRAYGAGFSQTSAPIATPIGRAA